MDPIDYFIEYERSVADFKLQLIARLAKQPPTPRPRREKRTSHIDIVHNVLAAAGRPLHIAAILQSAEKDFGLSLDRDSLSSAIVKQIRKGKRFVRTAPNTFGLKPS